MPLASTAIRSLSHFPSICAVVESGSITILLQRTLSGNDPCHRHQCRLARSADGEAGRAVHRVRVLGLQCLPSFPSLSSISVAERAAGKRFWRGKRKIASQSPSLPRLDEDVPRFAGRHYRGPSSIFALSLPESLIRSWTLAELSPTVVETKRVTLFVGWYVPPYLIPWLSSPPPAQIPLYAPTGKGPWVPGD